MNQIRLAREGLDFVQSFLENGSHLGRAASQLTQSGDEVLTWLPDGTEIGSVSLKEGFGSGQAPVPAGLWTPLEDLTRAFLDESPHHVAVVEAEYTYPQEQLADLIKACNRQYDFAYFTCDSVVDKDKATSPENARRLDVFGYLTGLGLSAARVSDFIELAAPFHQIVVLTSSAGGMIKSGSHVEKQYPTQIGLAAKHVAIGAYDGQGVVLWTRPDVWTDVSTGSPRR